VREGTLEPETPVRWGALWYWAPLGDWLAAIFFFSTDAMSAAHTSRFVEPLIRSIVPNASPETVYAVHVAVRKCGHLTEYGLLALLAFRAVRRGRPEPFRARWAAAAFAIASSYAVVDEFHQTFVASRTGNAGDVLVDMVGVAAALVALAWVRRRANSRARGDV
jgi:VanZ family protein